MIDLLPLAQHIDNLYPHLLEINTKKTNAEYILRIAQAAPAWFKALGIPDPHLSLLSKSGGADDGENGYLWPNGIKTSHDALCVPNGERADMIEKSDNAGKTPGRPDFNELPPKYWRPENKWVDISSWPMLPVVTEPVDPWKPPVVVTPPPPPPRPKPNYPGDSVFTQLVGKPLEEDYDTAGQSLNAGSATWFARPIWDFIMGNEGLTLEAAVKKHRYGPGGWREALGLNRNP